MSEEQRFNPAHTRSYAEAAGRIQDMSKHLRAFARNCVIHGDMTPTCERMIDRILNEYEAKERLDRNPETKTQLEQAEEHLDEAEEMEVDDDHE